MTRDRAASVKARLLGRAKATGERFELLLVRYACERFLYRLGASGVRRRCILKGASLVPVREAVLNKDSFEMHWSVGGPWEPAVA